MSNKYSDDNTKSRLRTIEEAISEPEAEIDLKSAAWDRNSQTAHIHIIVNGVSFEEETANQEEASLFLKLQGKIVDRIKIQ